MTATLRLVLDQIVAATDADLAIATREIARALVATAPSGCDVAAIVPSVPDASAALEAAVPGLVDVTRASLPRRELAASWQLGIAPGIGGGMIHSPTSLAPLVKHDRVHENDQTVVTMWDLAAWERAAEMSRPAVAWHRAMLKRAVKHADAVVVPTHAMAERLSEIAPLGDRLRVIAGAAPARFAVPTDEVGRRRALDIPDGCLVMSGSAAASAGLSDAFTAIAASGADLPVVVLDAPEGEEPALAEQAAASGLAEGRVHVRGTLEDADRAAVLGGAVALLAPSRLAGFPWRVVEALAVGVPVIAADSPTHREIVWDGGVLVPADEEGAFADALAGLLSSTAVVERQAVLAADRGRAFSWLSAAERVWQLHADL
ncbi:MULTISPECIES: glycosyltransferase [Microbacterium]|uniref:glycosyltransferase n=1 Tax=Microbacterium TaxID=33882 RepID=UPI00168B0C19|nr:MULTISPECIES: glycosyltransferase [Microbacterium]QOC26196.1 glycosyltransferase [Microbacterium hominis]QYF97498.1 glycosyltransferase [Microbacterium sp. PAMC21962]